LPNLRGVRGDLVVAGPRENLDGFGLKRNNVKLGGEIYYNVLAAMSPPTGNTQYFILNKYANQCCCFD
jgi:hypothetical protein